MIQRFTNTNTNKHCVDIICVGIGALCPEPCIWRSVFGVWSQCLVSGIWCPVNAHQLPSFTEICNKHKCVAESNLLQFLRNCNWHFNCLLQHHMVWQQLGKLFQYIHNSLVCRWPKDANDNGITNVKEKSILVLSEHWSADADGLPCRRGCTCRCAWQWNSKNTFSNHWFAECLWMQMQMPTSGGEGGGYLHPHP